MICTCINESTPQTTIDGVVYCVTLESVAPTIKGVKNPIYFDNTTLINGVVVPTLVNYFKDVSWTISYKPQEGKWNSFFTFYPDYSPFHNGFFQTSYNWGRDKGTMWNHSLNNSSFQVFQGRIEPFILEFPIQNENVLKQVDSLSFNVESKRYTNSWDYSVWKDIGFNKFYIYNNTKHSGILNLFPQKTLTDNRKYPRLNPDGTQDILYTAINGYHNVNYFINRALNQSNNVPLWLRDDNNIFKEVNPRAVSFTGKRTLERMQGDEEYVVGLVNDTESRFNITIKKVINKETIE